MLKPLVSVIITNFNYCDYIETAIQSVLDQSYEPIEIIVIDDGSTDSSISRLNRFGNSIKVICQENSGVSSARNKGIAESKGQYVAFLDADDYWQPHKIEMQIDLILKNPDEHLVFCDYLQLHTNLETIKPIKSLKPADFYIFMIKHPGRTPFIPSSVLMSRFLLNRVGEWDTNLKLAEDFDYFRRCSKISNFLYLPEAQVIHREHLRSLTAQSEQTYYLNNKRAFIKILEDDLKNKNLPIKQISIFKFQFGYVKFNLKKKNFFLALKMLWDGLKPINLFVQKL